VCSEASPTRTRRVSRSCCDADHPGRGRAEDPDLTDAKLNDHGHLYGPFAVGAVLSFVGAYLSVRFLVKYFRPGR